jgi:hypothetical protein
MGLLAKQSRPIPLSGRPAYLKSAKSIRKIALDFAAAAPQSFIPTYKRDAAGPNYANSWRLRHAIKHPQCAQRGDRSRGRRHSPSWAQDSLAGRNCSTCRSLSEQPAEPVDFRNEFPVTDKHLSKERLLRPRPLRHGWVGLYKTNRAKVVFFRNPHRGLFAMIQRRCSRRPREKWTWSSIGPLPG